MGRTKQELVAIAEQVLPDSSTVDKAIPAAMVITQDIAYSCKYNARLPTVNGHIL